MCCQRLPDGLPNFRRSLFGPKKSVASWQKVPFEKAGKRHGLRWPLTEGAPAGGTSCTPPARAPRPTGLRTRRTLLFLSARVSVHRTNVLTPPCGDAFTTPTDPFGRRSCLKRVPSVLSVLKTRLRG